MTKRRRKTKNKNKNKNKNKKTAEQGPGLGPQNPTPKKVDFSEERQAGITFFHILFNVKAKNVSLKKHTGPLHHMEPTRIHHNPRKYSPRKFYGHGKTTGLLPPQSPVL